MLYVLNNLNDEGDSYLIKKSHGQKKINCRDGFGLKGYKTCNLSFITCSLVRKIAFKTKWFHPSFKKSIWQQLIILNFYKTNLKWEKGRIVLAKILE